MTHPAAASRRTPLRRLVGAAALATGLLVAVVAPASAVTGSIDHVESEAGRVQAVVSLLDAPKGATPDLSDVTVTFDGEPVEATAKPLSAQVDGQLRRTVVLALDVSDSMEGRRFAEAKNAAEAFLGAAPDNVHVGLVTFAGSVVVAQEPTVDHAKVRTALEALTLSHGTRVHEAVLEALRQSGDEGVRSILLLSDGADTSGTSVDEVTTAVAGTDVNVDVVALDTSATASDHLREIARAGGGAFLEAGDPAALSELFGDEAAALAAQVLVTFEPPVAIAGREGTLEVSLPVGGTTLTDGAFVTLPVAEVDEVPQLGSSLAPADSGPVIAKEWMLLALVMTVGAVLAVVYLLAGSTSDRQDDSVAQRIDAYTRKGTRERQLAAEDGGSVTQQAVAVAANVLESRQGLADAVASRLDAAGLALKPAEWLLLHAATVIGATFLGLLLGGGSPTLLLLGLTVGAAGPWLYLMLKKKRRFAAFRAQLADTLQLMAGSLSAGLSLAQGVDTVVREGAEPMAGELRRALVESRLGVELEEALEGIGTRMESRDFGWVVMAIRIQREVGGNLAELLNKVAETIREREYLERQIKTLSAEGRLSVWILAGLPPVFMAYLMLTSADYVAVMFTSPLGWVMLIVMGLLLTGGTFWMTRLVKVEV